MKLLTFIIGFLLISASFGAKTSFQPHLSAKSNLGQILKQSSFGNGIISLVNLYAKNMQNQNAENWDDLFNALDLLKQSLKDKVDLENADYQLDGDAHTQEVNRINQRIIVLQGIEAGLEFFLQQLQDKYDRLSVDLKNLQGQLQAAQDSRDFEQNYLLQAEDKFNTEYADYQEAIDLLNEANEKLREALVKAESAGLGVFLQENQMNFESFAVLVEKSLAKLDTTKLFFAKPITAVFLEMQNLQEVDGTRIQNAIDALSNLIIHLQAGQMKLQANYQADKHQHTSLLQNYLEQINILINSQIPPVKDSMEDNREFYTENDNLLKSAQSELRVQQNNLEEENQSWVVRTEMHNMLLPKLADEIAIVESATQILKDKQQQV